MIYKEILLIIIKNEFSFRKEKQTTNSLLVRGTSEKYIRLLLAKILEKQKCPKLQLCRKNVLE